MYKLNIEKVKKLAKITIEEKIACYYIKSEILKRHGIGETLKEAWIDFEDNVINSFLVLKMKENDLTGTIPQLNGYWMFNEEDKELLNLYEKIIEVL